ncbi:hypothetical protein [Abyssicoccus albus]|uniref:Uncharacterized protein n=1 Tax=Abyssicoccus albus TaxID=1817405 RepID=A0A3N5C6S9_9BACL|nr:hypothetical protein [Abyssicoccus albus]RPF55162.1 hypothetical protein EDD62_1487 [Abyssicoccus albus]
MKDRVIEELKKMYKADKKDAKKDEVNFHVSKEYQTLIQEERNEHKIQIFNEKL